jgi:hypothetical protein
VIATSHRLPFSFDYSPGVLSAVQASVLRVRFANVTMASAVESAVAAFEALATLGAFSGAGIDPALSTLSLARSTSSTPGTLGWSLTRARLSDEALVPFAHLLLGAHPAASIQTVEVVDLLSPPVALRTDDSGSSYPELYRDPPFELDDDDIQGDDYAFEIELEEPLRPNSEDWLNRLFASWGRVVSMGAYAEAPTSPADAYVEPDPVVVAWDNQVEWALFKLRADGTSIDALINGLVAFHGRCQRIRRLTLS